MVEDVAYGARAIALLASGFSLKLRGDWPVRRLGRKGMQAALGVRLRRRFQSGGKRMNRYRKYGRRAGMALAMVCALAGCASVGRETAVQVPGEQRLSTAGSALVGAPSGWPGAVPLPEGAQIDGYRCADRYCTLWFGLMDLDGVMALRRKYIAMLKDSGKWEQLGAPGDPYEHEAFRYKGEAGCGCGYTLEIRSGSVPNDYYHRFRVTTSLTW